MGEHLAERILERFPGNDHDIDVVIPIPDTGRTAALPLAYELNVKYREGFIKNRYIGRTFIMPGQKQRQKSVRQKLNAIELEFKGKNVLLVDDSIVRGTTIQQIIQMAREAGAQKGLRGVRGTRRSAIRTSTASTCPRQRVRRLHRTEDRWAS